MKLSKSGRIICILFILTTIIITRFIFVISPTPINEAYQSLYQRLKDKKTKRLEKDKKEKEKRGRQTDWGIDYHGSVKFDNYYVPQINFSPAYIFFDSDYYTY
jgi:hypothetical protein